MSVINNSRPSPEEFERLTAPLAEMLNSDGDTNLDSAGLISLAVHRLKGSKQGNDLPRTRPSPAEFELLTAPLAEMLNEESGANLDSSGLISVAVNRLKGFKEQKATAEQQHSAALGNVTAERDDARRRVAELEAETPDVALAQARHEVQLLTLERDAAQSRMKKVEIDVTRLESMCGLKGFDHSSLPIAATELESGADIYNHWLQLKGREKTAYYRANEQALVKYSQQQHANQLRDSSRR